ncbi:MAG: MFS transporter [Gammaproteobacteria bacterium]|nr:MFS transporter [Gammaproteobacteria bacterium]
MRHILPTIAALLLSVAVLMLANGLLGIFLAVRMTLEAFPVQITGTAMSAYFLGLVVGTQVTGIIIRRVGHIRAFAAFAALTNAAVVCHGLWISAPVWIVLRMLTGLSVSGLYMVIESWLNDRATSATRGRVFSLYMITSFLGLGVGQFLLNLRDPKGLDLFLVAAALFALAVVPMALTRAIHPQPIEHEPFGLRGLLRRSPLGIIGSFGAGLVNGAFYALGPVYALDVGLGTAGASGFMSLTILGGLLLQWPVGHLSDRLDRRRMFQALTLALLVATLAILGLRGRSLPLLLVLAAVYGGLSYTLYPIAVAHANDLLDPPQFVPAAATLLFTWGIGAALGPIGAGALMARVGPAGLFVFVALACIALAIVTQARRRETVPTEEQTPFVAMARTTPVITELDPRALEEEGTPSEPEAATTAEVKP